MKMKKFKQFFLEKQVLGLIEFFDIEGIGKIPSKLDSGNGAFNVLHGDNIQAQGKKLFFKTVNNKTIVKDIKETITINVGSGHTEERPVVHFNLTVGDKSFNDVPFSIGDRTTNIYKILVGKDFIEKNLDALIDVGQENIADDNIQVN